MLKNVIVCGGRNFNDKGVLFHTLHHICFDRGWIIDYKNLWYDVRIIAGDASGADSLAIDWAVTHWCLFDKCKTQWELYGKDAVSKRNAEMLAQNPDLVVAFLPQGTLDGADMVCQARAAGVEVFEVGE